MNTTTRSVQTLTHSAALRILAECVRVADKLHAPVHIVIASSTGRIQASLSMDGAYFLSLETATNKALTAASHRVETRCISEEIKAELAVASGGKITAMAGGLPIWIEGECVGGVGVGGASDEADIEIAFNGIRSIGAFCVVEDSLDPKLRGKR
jgi:glc operon protein GlcG